MSIHHTEADIYFTVHTDTTKTSSKRKYTINEIFTIRTKEQTENTHGRDKVDYVQI